jgi:hypothetical protein
MNPPKPIVIIASDWRIPPVAEDGSIPEDAVCMEASALTTANMYVSCGWPATMRLRDDRAGRSYYFCSHCAVHNMRRGMTRE